MNSLDSDRRQRRKRKEFHNMLYTPISRKSWMQRVRKKFFFNGSTYAPACKRDISMIL